jgi:ferredoxin
MKISVDEQKCSGQARCTAVAPQVYQLDDEGYNRMGVFAVLAGQEGVARRGARGCPERAIEIIED